MWPAEAATRNATARFADAAIRGDDDGFRAVWAEDGRWTIGDPPHVDAAGADEIVSTLRRLREGKEFFVQFAVQGPIVIDGDQATTSCVCHEAARGPGETYYRNHAIASDHLTRSQGGWVFSHRAFHYLWLDTSPFVGDSFTLPSRDARAA